MEDKGENLFHLGTAIKNELISQQRTVTWFAHQICCTRSHVYRIFEKDNMDVHLLIRISKILNHNFFNDLVKEYLLPN